VLFEEPVNKGMVVYGAFYEQGPFIDLVCETATEIVEYDYGMASGDQFLHHMGTHESGTTRNKGNWHALNVDLECFSGRTTAAKMRMKT